MKVSILICTYNAEQFVAEAIQSALKQTYKDFELIIVNDGSIDKTLEICQSFNDCRIKIVTRKHGYIASLNAGLRQCRGEYIARMDADDIMEPDRLKVQVEKLDSSPDVAVCSSWAQTIGEKEMLVGNYVSGKIENITPLFLNGNFIIHSTAMIRRSFLIKHRVQYKNYPFAEDFKLWVDIAQKGGLFYILPYTLIHYRLSMGQTTRLHWSEQEMTRVRIQQEIIEEELQRIPLKYKKTVQKLYFNLLSIYRIKLLTAENVIKLMSLVLNNRLIDI